MNALDCFEKIDLDALERDLIQIRRELHQNPEAGWTEFETTVKIIGEAERLGLHYRFGKEIHTPEYMYGMPDANALEQEADRAAERTGRTDLIDRMRGGNTGCIVRIEGSEPGPASALRFDIDCNDVQETDAPEHMPNRLGFASTRKNLMHACGHDGHAAIGIGVMRLLAACRERLKGSVTIAFQPAEEGARGADSMTRTGFLKGIQYIVACHLGIKARELGLIIAGCHGFLASTKLDVTFTGRAAHAAISPESGRNALAAAAVAVSNLLAIPRHSAGSSRVNVGVLNSGTGRNVIPDRAFMAIETRGADSAINAFVENCAKRVCRNAAEMYECAHETRTVGLNCNTVCDPELVAFVHRSAVELPDVTEILDDVDFGGGDDVAYMMNYVRAHGGKATDILIGCDLDAPHHSTNFDFNERAILIGVKVLTKAILDLSECGGLG